jgi:pimeloyl-ACP methyl ester carboxylesterase
MAADTRVVVGHSLGSVVAYEALCAHPQWPVHTFVSLGSPLGVRNLLFDRLNPPPERGIGAWPGSIQSWVNIADRGDVVALVKRLRARFGDRVQDRMVDNGARAHDVGPNLTAQETGEAIAASLTL